MATVHDFTIDQGAKCEIIFQYTDKVTGLPIPLADVAAVAWRARMEVRQPRNSATTLLTADTSDGRLSIIDKPLGKVRLLLTSAVTALLDWYGQAFYDIELIPPGATGPDNKERLAEGHITLAREVTKGMPA